MGLVPLYPGIHSAGVGARLARDADRHRAAPGSAASRSSCWRSSPSSRSRNARERARDRRPPPRARRRTRILFANISALRDFHPGVGVARERPKRCAQVEARADAAAMAHRRARPSPSFSCADNRLLPERRRARRTELDWKIDRRLSRAPEMPDGEELLHPACVRMRLEPSTGSSESMKSLSIRYSTLGRAGAGRTFRLDRVERAAPHAVVGHVPRDRRKRSRNRASKNHGNGLLSNPMKNWSRFAQAAARPHPPPGCWGRYSKLIVVLRGNPSLRPQVVFAGTARGPVGGRPCIRRRSTARSR